MAARTIRKTTSRRSCPRAVEFARFGIPPSGLTPTSSRTGLLAGARAIGNAETDGPCGRACCLGAVGGPLEIAKHVWPRLLGDAGPGDLVRLRVMTIVQQAGDQRGARIGGFR